MAALLCARKTADEVDFENERFVVCKATGVNVYGKRYELGDELPQGVLNPRAIREIYDTPTRLVETMDYALADEQLLKAMMDRPAAEEGEVPEDDDEEKEPLAAPVVGSDGVPKVVRPGKRNKRN